MWLMMEAETGVMWFEDERKGHKQRDVDDHEKLKRVRKQILPPEPQKEPCQHLIFNSP